MLEFIKCFLLVDITLSQMPIWIVSLSWTYYTYFFLWYDRFYMPFYILSLHDLVQTDVKLNVGKYLGSFVLDAFDLE